MGGTRRGEEAERARGRPRQAQTERERLRGREGRCGAGSGRRPRGSRTATAGSGHRAAGGAPALTCPWTRRSEAPASGRRPGGDGRVWVRLGPGRGGGPRGQAYLAQGRGHLVGERAGHDHDVRLARAGAEDHAEAVHVVAGRRHVHHLHGAAGQAEGHGPQGTLPGAGAVSPGRARHGMPATPPPCPPPRDLRCRSLAQCALQEGEVSHPGAGGEGGGRSASSVCPVGDRDVAPTARSVLIQVAGLRPHSRPTLTASRGSTATSNAARGTSVLWLQALAECSPWPHSYTQTETAGDS